MPPIARGDDKVLVAVRVRPLNDAERANGGGEAWSVASGAENTIAVISHGDRRGAHGTGTKSEVRMRERERVRVVVVFFCRCRSSRRGRLHRVRCDVINGVIGARATSGEPKRSPKTLCVSRTAGERMASFVHIRSRVRCIER